MIFQFVLETKNLTLISAETVAIHMTALFNSAFQISCFCWQIPTTWGQHLIASAKTDKSKGFTHAIAEV